MVGTSFEPLPAYISTDGAPVAAAGAGEADGIVLVAGIGDVLAGLDSEIEIGHELNVDVLFRALGVLDHVDIADAVIFLVDQHPAGDGEAVGVKVLENDFAGLIVQARDVAATVGLAAVDHEHGALAVDGVVILHLAPAARVDHPVVALRVVDAVGQLNVTAGSSADDAGEHGLTQTGQGRESNSQARNNAHHPVMHFH